MEELTDSSGKWSIFHSLSALCRVSLFFSSASQARDIKEMSSCMESVQLAFENYPVNEPKNYDAKD